MWIGRLSPPITSSWSRVTTQHEKSWALLSTPDRLERKIVFIMLATVAWNRLLMTASRTPSTAIKAPFRRRLPAAPERRQRPDRDGCAKSRLGVAWHLRPGRR